MKRVPLPTTRWVGPIERFDQREQQHTKAAVGALGARNSPLRSWLPIGDGPVKVTTDLPLAVDSPVDIGVQEFCNLCNKCAKWCPSQCISYGPKQVERGGLEKWPIDNDKCIVYWNANRNKWNDCARCITVCPWNQPRVWYQKLAVRLAPTAIGRRLLLRLDALLFPGRKRIQPKGGWLHYTRSTDAGKFENGQVCPPT